jgi:CcmD family protein
MMGQWGYVFLAYGIVWGAIVVYFILLKGRYRRAESELSRLRAGEDARSDGPK